MAGGKQQHNGDSFPTTPRPSCRRRRLLLSNWDFFSPLHRELRLKCSVLCGFLVFFSRQREITVLYPSLADWSESPPYSALPRPGVEPLENKRTALFTCDFPLLSSSTDDKLNTSGFCWLENINKEDFGEGGRARMAMLHS